MRSFVPHAQLLQGDRGLLFTDSPPEEVLEWFADYKQADYARTGNVVDEEFVLPEGQSFWLSGVRTTRSLAYRETARYRRC